MLSNDNHSTLSPVRVHVMLKGKMDRASRSSDEGSESGREDDVTKGMVDEPSALPKMDGTSRSSSDDGSDSDRENEGSKKIVDQPSSLPLQQPKTSFTFNRDTDNQPGPEMEHPNTNLSRDTDDEEEEENQDMGKDDDLRTEGLSTNPSSTNVGLRLDWSSTRFGEPKRSTIRELIHTINRLRFNCGMMVNNKHVQMFVVFLIAVNAIMMGVGTFPIIKENERNSHIFEQVDLVFLIVFTVELCLQFIYHGFRLLLDGWLVFDLIIIITSWTFSSVQVIRAFRIFRALRLVTRIKVMKNLMIGKIFYK